ncbi:lysis protein [Shigella sonnei]|nr:lysis protein [Shigella sonnei]EFZ5528699.1 lysis protein [Shigella sonnei]
MSSMYTRAADNSLVTGVALSSLSSFINYFSPSEWMVIGIVVGIVCSIIGCASGIIFRFRRERILNQWIISRSLAGHTDHEIVDKIVED